MIEVEELLRTELETMKQRHRASLGYITSLASLITSSKPPGFLKDSFSSQAFFYALTYLYLERDALRELLGEKDYKVVYKKLHFDEFDSDPKFRTLTIGQHLTTEVRMRTKHD